MMIQKLPRMAVCRIVMDRVNYDFQQPYNSIQEGGSSTGTGFFLSGVVAHDGTPLLITAYHCCELAIRLRVLVEAHGSEFLEARLIGANPKMDIALLRVDGLTPSIAPIVFELSVGDSDKCHMAQRIQAVGFALGKTWNQSTVGVISGRTYVHLQVDAAVNGGNSGGPVLDSKGRVIGVVLAGITKAQNVNYMAPINETLMTLRRIQNRTESPARIDNADLNCRCVPAPSALVKMLQAPAGVLVSSCFRDTPLHKIGVRAGDIIFSIAGHTIDAQGRIDVSWWVDKLPIYALLSRITSDMDVKVGYWSRLSRERIVANTHLLEGTVAAYETKFPEFDPIPYSCLGGIVVQPLNKNLLQIFRHLAAFMTRPDHHEDSVLVISSVLPESPFSEMHTVSAGDIILSVNDTPTRTLDQYTEAFKKGLQADGVRIVIRDGNELAASSDALLSTHATIQKRIPTISYA